MYAYIMSMYDVMLYHVNYDFLVLLNHEKLQWRSSADTCFDRGFYTVEIDRFKANHDRDRSFYIRQENC